MSYSPLALLHMARTRYLLLMVALALTLPHSAGVVAQGELEEVLVTAHSRDYRLDTAESALGLNVEILRTPAAVSVITEDLLKDQQVNNVDDALRNVAGVNQLKTGNGGEEQFSIRGFNASQSIYKDGARINNPNNASNIPSTETANIARIEVLKGPSALLYGQGEPGGIVNYVTKRPEIERTANVELLYGSDSFKKIEFDATGAFDSGEHFAGRIVGAYEDSDSFRNEVFRKRLLLNPSVVWHPDQQTSVFLGYEYIDDDYTQDRGQVLQGNDSEGYFYGNLLNDKQFFGIPDWNRKTTAESSRVYFFADRQMTDFWSLEFDFNYTENDKTNVDSSPRPIQADATIVGAPGTEEESQVNIEPRRSEGTGETSRYNLKNTFMFGDGFGFDHQLVLSASFEDFDTQSTSFRGDRFVRFNISTGEYFTPDMRPVNPNDQEIVIGDNIIFGLRDRGSATRQDFDETGVNLLDYITFNEHWAWLIGARYSKYEDKLEDFDDDDISFRSGIVYTHHDDLSFYVSFSEGYTSSAGRLQLSGDSIDPETSTAWELGTKWQPNDGLLLTATVYQIQKQDLGFLVNPDAPPGEQFYTNVGKVQSQGLELEAVGFITPQWRIQAGYSYVDSEVKEGGVGEFNAVFPKGNAFPGVPENSFNAFTFYEFDIGDGVFGLGGGVYYVDEVFISLENRSKYDDWYQLDLGAYYKRGGWKIQLNVDNVTDEDYRLAQAAVDTDAFGATRVGTSDPRRYIVSFAYEI